MALLKKLAIQALCALIPFRETRRNIRHMFLTKKPLKKTPQSQYLLTVTDAARFKQYPDNPLQNYFLSNTKGDLNKWHHYFPIYHRHFSKFRHSAINVLEIGVDKGGSLKMWKDYFGKNCNIYGIDIDPAAKRFDNPAEGIHVIIGDQGDEDFLAQLMRTLPKITIFIDDGGHMTSQQNTTFLTCYDKIADDGVYVCEDLHTNYWSSFIDTDTSFIDFIINHVHSLNAWFQDNPGLNQWMVSCPPGESNRRGLKIPLFTHITHSISFYNSMIVIEKENVVEPRVERR